MRATKMPLSPASSLVTDWRVTPTSSAMALLNFTTSLSAGDWAVTPSTRERTTTRAVVDTIFDVC